MTRDDTQRREKVTISFAAPPSPQPLTSPHLPPPNILSPKVISLTKSHQRPTGKGAWEIQLLEVRSCDGGHVKGRARGQ